MLVIPVELLQISRLRPAVPLPWPSARAIALARTVGFVQPVTVRSLPQTVPPRYEILSGLRHWLLAQRAQVDSVTVLVRDGLSDAAVRQLVEQDTAADDDNPMTTARALQALVVQQGSIAAAGRVLGLSRAEASNRLRLLQLSPTVQALVEQGSLAPGKARALVGLPQRVQEDLVQRIAQEGLRTRQVEALTNAFKQQGGSYPAAEMPPAAQPAKDIHLVRLERDLAELVGSPVTIHYGTGGQGQLVIEFANLDILDGVLEKLGYNP